jgi:outer membrane protein assembly factor BamB
VLAPVHTVPAPGERLCGVAWDGRHLWHSDAGTERIYCLDPGSGRVLRELACPVRTCLAWDGRRLWQVAGRPKRLRCLDPEDGSTVRELPLESERACGVEIDGRRFWSTNDEGWLELRSLADGALLRTHRADPRIAGVTVARGLVWYAVDERSLLVAVDRDTGEERQRHRVEGTPTGLTFDGDRLWYADLAGRRLVAVDPPR